MTPVRRRIMVIEDNDEEAASLRDLLEAHGHSVLLAHNAPIALSLAHDFDPDVVLLDITLPVMDGYELARRLRERRPAARFIAVTARRDDAARQQSLEVGCIAHVTKPYAVEHLLGVIDAIDE